MNTPSVSRYLAYLLRAWQERPASRKQPGVWRFSLEDVNRQEKQGFGSIEALANFLAEQLTHADEAQSEPPASEEQTARDCE